MSLPNSREHVEAGEAELHLGKVDPDDAGTCGEVLGDRDTGSATRAKDTCARWQADNEIIEQRHVRRIVTT